MGCVRHISNEPGDCHCAGCRAEVAANEAAARRKDAQAVVEKAAQMPKVEGDRDLGRFVHLHCHSNLSFKDSINNIDDLARFVAYKGMKAVALTDHGHMFGAIRLAIACKEVGIKPIFGMEAYEAIPHDVTKTDEEPGYSPHLTLLVMNEVGWRNLVALHTKSYQLPLAYFNKNRNRLFPRIDRATLEDHSEGLICMSACLGGKVARAFVENPSDDAKIRETMAWYRDVFGDRFYVETMANSPEQKAIIHHQRTLCRAERIPYVPTNDVHYLEHWQGYKMGPHNIFSASRWGPSPLEGRWADAQGEVEDGENNTTGWYGSDEFFMKDPNEMIASGFTEAELRVSLQIADRCIGFDPTEHIKAVPVPAPIEDRDEFELSMFDSWRQSPERILR